MGEEPERMADDTSVHWNAARDAYPRTDFAICMAVRQNALRQRNRGQTKAVK